MKNKKTRYIIYDRDEMKEKFSLKLTESQLKRLSIRPRWWVFFIIFGILFTIFGIILYNAYQSRDNYKQEVETLNEEIIINNRNNTLHCLIGEYALLWNTPLPDDTLVYQFIKDAGAWYPDIMMAQWCIESAHGTSDVATNANNHYGMRPAKTRFTLQEKNAEYKGYGVYRNWQWSTLDRILWDLHVFDTIPNRNAYLDKLKNIYAENKNYIPVITKEAAKWKKLDAKQDSINALRDEY